MVNGSAIERLVEKVLRLEDQLEASSSKVKDLESKVSSFEEFENAVRDRMGGYRGHRMNMISSIERKAKGS